MPESKCYWPVITVVDQTGKEIVINGQAISSIQQVVVDGQKIAAAEVSKYSICCDKPPKNFDEKRCESVKKFLQQRCEEINETDATTSKLLQILLAYCSDSTTPGFSGQTLLELKDIKERFLRFINKITIKNIKFIEATEKSKKSCRCSPGETSVFADEFTDSWNTQMCSDPPPEPPINEDPDEEPTLGEPKPPSPKPQTPPPTESLFLGSINFSNDCLQNNKTKIISAVVDILSLLKPETDTEGNKLETILIEELSKKSKIELKPIVNQIKKSPVSQRSVDIKDIITSTIVSECTIAKLNTYKIPENVLLVSGENINKSNKNQYSQYADKINITVPPNTTLVNGFIPKTFNLDLYNQKKHEENLEKVGVYLYNSLPPNNTNKYYTLNPVDIIRVPVELVFNYFITLNLEQLTVPFIINPAGLNSETLEPCEEIEGTKEITLSRENKEIHNDFYTIKFQATTIIYVDYKLVKPGNTAATTITTKIVSYPDPKDRKFQDYTTILGDENPIFHMQFAPSTKDDTIKRFADTIIDPSTKKSINYTVISQFDGKYLIFNTNGQILRSIIENGQMLIPSVFIVCQYEEIATRDNVDKWINLKCQPKVQYVERAKYVLVDQTNGGAYGSDSVSNQITIEDPENPNVIQIVDQIEKNLTDATKVSVQILENGKFNQQMILTKTGIEKIKKVLETKVKKTECCCYNWVIGFIANLQKYFYIPFKKDGKEYAIFTKKLTPEN